MTGLDISVVVPSFNEAESLPELCSWIDKVMQKHDFSYEVVIIDDGSTDNQWEVVTKLSQQNSSIKGIKFKRNYGKSAALSEGFKLVKGEVVITMDADLQDSPDEIPELRRMILQEGYDIVSGWKSDRKDPLSKTIPTKLYNATTRFVTGVKLHDMNCGLKAYKLEVVKNVKVYGEMHRYIPAIAKWTGYTKIGEKAVSHQARKYGSSKFGLERFVNGFLDLMSITFVMKFRKKPMHFFGTMGTLSTAFGALAAIYLLCEKLYKIWFLGLDMGQVRDVTDQPLFFMSLTAVVIGVQLFLAGFLGELIHLNKEHKDEYLISDKLNHK